MKKYLLLGVIYSAFVCLAICADPSFVLRKLDLDDFRITIFEESGFYIQAVSKLTGHFFGITQIYHGLTRQAVEADIQGLFLLEEVQESVVFIRVPMYETPAELSRKELTDEQRRFNLLDIKFEDLQKENDELEQKIETLQTRQHFGLTTSDDWVYYADDGIYTTIDISHLNLEKTPHVQVSLNGGSWIWTTTGGSSIYELSNKAFSVYLRYSNGDPLTTDMAKKLNWHLSYTVTSMD